MSRPGWLIAGGFTHISGHQSAVGRAQDREFATLPRNEGLNRPWATTKVCYSFAIPPHTIRTMVIAVAPVIFSRLGFVFGNVFVSLLR